LGTAERFFILAIMIKVYINRLNFKVNGLTAAIDHPEFIDIAKLVLPLLCCGQTINITRFVLAFAP